MSLPVLQSLSVGELVHQLLAVAGQPQFRQGVRPRPRRYALADEPYAPTQQVGVGPGPDPNRRRDASVAVVKSGAARATTPRRLPPWLASVPGSRCQSSSTAR